MPSASRNADWRVLVALLVYNGEEFVRSCLASLAGCESAPHVADVLVLDDASPAPGWSERCQELTETAGFQYYRSPRNLGIPRNMNLALLRAMDENYDAVVLLNADTVVPSNLVPTLVQPLLEDDAIASTTAWSNNASIYSLPTGQPERLATSQQLLDWVSEKTAEEFGSQAIPIPSGVGFCLAMPTRVVRDVGLMDPIFGRGYSEEIDWCLRSHTMGYHSALAPGCFVYHAGSGVTMAEGLVGPGETLASAHQEIIDQRYPLYRAQVTAFIASSIPGSVVQRGQRRIVVSASRELGYVVDVTRGSPSDDELVRFTVDPEVPGTIVGSFNGIRTTFEVGAGVLPTIAEIAGGPPKAIRIQDRGEIADTLVAAANGQPGIEVTHRMYPQRVL